MNHSRPDPDDAPCDGCGLAPDRREFVRQMGLAAVGALMLVGVPAGLAASVTPEAIVSRRRVGANPSYPIPPADGVQIDHDNQVILVRWKGEVYAFNLSCPHQNTALRWNQGDSEFQCPKHHSKYQPDGTFISGRATRNMDRFTLARTGNNVVVNVGAMHKNDVDPAGWNAAAIPIGQAG
ncbi:MAG TPA: Rieske (2Fe-2S) protein [Gemmatimonadales bacterium]